MYITKIKTNRILFSKNLFNYRNTHYDTSFLRPSAYKTRMEGISLRYGIEQIYLFNYRNTHYGTSFLRPSAHKTRIEGISPRYGIEQICESDIDSSAHSQSGQFFLGKRFVPPTMYITNIKTNRILFSKNLFNYRI